MKFSCELLNFVGLVGPLVAMAFIALLCPCSLRSFPMLYVAYARRVRSPTRRASQRHSSTAPSAKTVVSKPLQNVPLYKFVISLLMLPSRGQLSIRYPLGCFFKSCTEGGAKAYFLASECTVPGETGGLCRQRISPHSNVQSL